MQQQYESTARPAAAPVQSSPQHVTPQMTKGWLVRLKHWIVGEQDPIEQQMREIARQGLGMVRLAHTMGTIMILAFSLGSAVGICSTLIDSITRAGMFTWAAIPFDIAFVVSVLLVVCFDVASVYASFMVRLLYTRHAPKGDYTYHVAIIVLACLLESGTFGYMSWKYDDPALLAVAVLIIVRAVGSPIVALYLNMARQIPISPSDISYHNFLAAGKGVIRDVVHVANDHTAPLPDKIELYGASYAMRPHEEKQFERLMAAAEKREARLAQSQRRLPPPRIVAASATLPLSETLEHHVAKASAYKAMHDADEWQPTSPSAPADPWDVADETVGYEDEDPGITAVYSEDELTESVATSTSSPRHSTRSTAHSGPAKKTTSRGEAISKGMKKSHKERKKEGTERRQRIIERCTFQVLDEWYASGVKRKLTDEQLADKVFELGDLIVRPSENNVSRLRDKWLAKSKRDARELEVEPMEPQELRELVSADTW
jgi:hypothetical protein